MTGSFNRCRLRWLLLAPLVLPLAVAAQGLALVSSEKDHALTILDLKTQAVTGVIATCKRPRHMQLTPDRRQILVACGDSGEADVIDVATRQSLRRVKLGQDPEIFDIAPDGKTLYVSNEEDAVVGIIDLASGQRKSEIKVGGEPEGVKLSADGKTLYVTSEVANVVHVIDLATARIVANVKTGKRPRRFALTPDGSQLWVSNELDASVTVIDTRTNQPIETLKFQVKGAREADITPVGLTMSRDGKRAFVGLGRASHVAFVDVATRKVTDLVLVGKRVWSVALDRSEKTLLAVNGLSDDLTIIDVATAKPLKTVKMGRVPHTVLVIE
ncbi:MAG: PQQ-dependent catabolism-associated beta-propeller protein [Rubrivivax sp.]|nr:PQQ-dependent catabolism-associated beta-propeller protein [Rubrivivax sp.]